MRERGKRLYAWLRRNRGTPGKAAAFTTGTGIERQIMNTELKQEYKSIPVQTARELSIQFEKAVVIICAWDDVHKRLHTTTYGTTPAFKIAAGRGGEICATALGMDLSNKEPTEDFRTVDAAKNAQLKDMVLRHLPAIKEMASQILSPADNTFLRMVRDFEEALK